MNRADYQREYYRSNSIRLNRRTRQRNALKHWAGWLLANLTWPVEPTSEVSRIQPIRRPTLRLRKI